MTDRRYGLLDDPWAWRSNMDAQPPAPQNMLSRGPDPTGRDKIFDALYGALGGTPENRPTAEKWTNLLSMKTPIGGLDLSPVTAAYDGGRHWATTGQPGELALAMMMPGAKPVSAAAKAVPAAAAPYVTRGYRGSIMNTEKYRDPQFGTGPWASSNPEVANTYAQTAWDGASPNVTPMEFRFSNPFIHDAKGADWDKIPGTDPRFFVGDGLHDSTDNIADRAQKLGHDGMVLKNVRDKDHADLGPPADVIRPLQRGTTYSPITKELLYGLAPLLGGGYWGSGDQ